MVLQLGVGDAGLDALTRALQLDTVEREHLTDLLARPKSARRTPAAPQRVRPGLYLCIYNVEPGSPDSEPRPADRAGTRSALLAYGNTAPAAKPRNEQVMRSRAPSAIKSGPAPGG
ncbi:MULTISPECIES: hypothetical protein [unclassified Kribbella]|uniref:hypothetical protein n=1 Tax=unclassified Kribbella TaxID=2644121 RepID=UPI0033F1865C